MENEHIKKIMSDFDIGYEDDIRFRLSSLDIINLIIKIEEVFETQISEIDINNNYSLKQIVYEYTNYKEQ